MTFSPSDIYEFTKYDFIDCVLVECPKCGKAAKVLRLEKPSFTENIARLTCIQCGLSRHRNERNISYWDNAHDPYFDLPLWLQTEVLGHILWAYNERHLALLEAFIPAKNRSRKPYMAGTIKPRNKSLGSRLPRWVTSAKNRAEVISSLKKLRQKLN